MNFNNCEALCDKGACQPGAFRWPIPEAWRDPFSEAAKKLAVDIECNCIIVEDCGPINNLLLSDCECLRIMGADMMKNVW